MIKKEAGEEMVSFMTFREERVPPEVQSDVAEFRRLLGLNPTASEYRVRFASLPGNDKAVKATAGAVGYLELNYAKDAGFPVASIQNRAGEFIAPSPASAALAVAAFSDALSKDVRSPIVDPPAAAKGAYPITGLTFVIIPKKQVLPGEQQKFKDFVAYCLTDGQNSAEAMSYTKLPTPVVQQGQMLLAQLVTDDNKPSN